MKLEHFRYLLTIDRLRSISSAARELHIRQTTLSAIVKSAEEELGYVLFERAPGGVSTTPAGEQFMSLAWEINTQYEELLSIQNTALTGAQSIKILVAPPTAFRFTLALTERFKSIGFKGNLTFEEENSSHIVASLVDHSASIGIAYLTERNLVKAEPDRQKHDLVIEPLLTTNLQLVCHKDHPFAALPYVPLSSVYDERLATAKSIRNDAILGKSMMNCTRISSFTDTETVLLAVRDWSMIAFLPAFTLTGLTEFRPEFADLRAVPIKDTPLENKLYLCLIYHGDHSIHYQEKRILKEIRHYFWTLLAYHPEFTITEGEAGNP